MFHVEHRFSPSEMFYVEHFILTHAECSTWNILRFFFMFYVEHSEIEIILILLIDFDILMC